MKKFIYTFVLLVGVLLSGCEKDEKSKKPTDTKEVETVFSANYIQSYTVVQDVKEYWTIPGTIGFTGREIDNQSPAKKAEYDALSEQYNDRTYNGYLPLLQNCVMVGIRDISVTCTPAFDERHTAGEPVDDRVWMVFESPRDYIQSGYKAATSPPTRFVAPPFPTGREGFEEKAKRLSECTTDDFHLIDPNVNLEFAVDPKPGKYLFTLTVQFENGKESRRNVTVTINAPGNYEFEYR